MKTMKAFLTGVLALALSSVPTLAAAPQSWEGVWKNTRNTVHIRISQCGQAMCGTVIWAVPQAKADALRGSGRQLIGSQLFSGFRRSDDGTWRGKVYIPDVDSTGSATITFVNPDLIQVSGCLFLGLACRTQHWQRIGT